MRAPFGTHTGTQGGVALPPRPRGKYRLMQLEFGGAVYGVLRFERTQRSTPSTPERDFPPADAGARGVEVADRVT